LTTAVRDQALIKNEKQAGGGAALSSGWQDETLERSWAGSSSPSPGGVVWPSALSHLACHRTSGSRTI